ncbi:MAG TPA: hypothetical protein VMB19_15330 [Silvibacterium sp.]|nr:hypothetical protein [Silvibacterium sp.]
MVGGVRISGLLLTLLCVTFLSPDFLVGQCSTPIDKEAAPKAVVEVSLDKASIHVGETPLITFRITNRGSVPFYVPRAIEDFDFHGGFKAIVTGPPNARWNSTGGAVDHFHYIDVAKEIEESWVLLWPCDFYGGARPLATVPMSPGTYTVVGRRNPPRLGDDLKAKLRSTLRFPVLLDALESQPISLRVTE